MLIDKELDGRGRNRNGEQMVGKMGSKGKRNGETFSAESECVMRVRGGGKEKSSDQFGRAESYRKEGQRLIEECLAWRYKGEPRLNMDSKCESFCSKYRSTSLSHLFEILATGYKGFEQIHRHNFRTEPNHPEMERFRYIARKAYLTDHKPCWVLLGVNIKEKHTHSDNSL